MTKDLHQAHRRNVSVPRSLLSRGRRRLVYEHRVMLWAILIGLVPSVTVIALLLTGNYTARFCLTVSLVVVCSWVGFVAGLQIRAIHPLRTVSNMLAALREGDFSIRAREARTGDALGEVLLEINDLSETLHDQRLGALEATTLLRKVMSEIDVAVFSFDESQKLRLVNHRGEKLMRRTSERLLSCQASALGLQECLEGDTPRIVDVSFAGGSGRYEVRRSTFRMSGQPHHLIMLSDLTSTLREEERQAWKRLVQVLRHEINNSLAPIDSLAGSLSSLLTRKPRADDWESDMIEGLDVISQRSKALNRFMTAYSQLTKLPPPRPKPMKVEDWVRRVAGLETRQVVTIDAGPDVSIDADSDQLDQLLINLIRNAVDAAQETSGSVAVGWGRVEGTAPGLEVWVDDEGLGLSSTENLFVPFFTTKQEGSGIGLALCRQIAEAHGGLVSLENRPEGVGCRATVRLPLGSSATDENAN